MQLLTHHFCGPPITESSVEIEQSLLWQIERLKDWQLFRTTAYWRGQDFQSGTYTIYRLKSARHHCYFDFVRDGENTNVLLLHVEPDFQGSFWNLKRAWLDFLTIIFEADRFCLCIHGTPGPLDGYPVKKRREADKILRLYLCMGMQSWGDSVFFSRESYEADRDAILKHVRANNLECISAAK